MPDAQSRTTRTPLRAWLKLTAEFPDLRRDLGGKLAYFLCWRLARD